MEGLRLLEADNMRTYRRKVAKKSYGGPRIRWDPVLHRMLLHAYGG